MKQHTNRFLELVMAVKPHIKEIDVDAVKKKLDHEDVFYLIDVREDSEWNEGHLPNAIHLCKGIVERDIEKVVFDDQAQIIVYCGGGYRSALVADNLNKMGYHNVFSMDGGFGAWMAKRYEVQRG